MLAAGQAFVLKGPPTAMRPAPKRMPGPVALARNVTAAAAKVAAGALAGQPVFTDDQTKAKRLALCNACSEYYVADKERCSHPKCGCYMRFKTALLAMKCPDGRW